MDHNHVYAIVYSVQTLLSANQSARTIVVTFRDGPLENLSEGGGRAKYNKNIRARKNEKMKKKIMRANKP